MLFEVYEYYAHSGFASIALSRILNLLTVGFVIAFTTFLWGCIDYSKLPRIGEGGKGGRLHDVMIPQCLARYAAVDDGGRWFDALTGYHQSPLFS